MSPSARRAKGVMRQGRFCAALRKDALICVNCVRAVRKIAARARGVADHALAEQITIGIIARNLLQGVKIRDGNAPLANEVNHPIAAQA